jgi:hypothetical protein
MEIQNANFQNNKPMDKSTDSIQPSIYIPAFNPVIDMYATVPDDGKRTYSDLDLVAESYPLRPPSAPASINKSSQ